MRETDIGGSILIVIGAVLSWLYFPPACPPGAFCFIDPLRVYRLAFGISGVFSIIFGVVVGWVGRMNLHPCRPSK